MRTRILALLFALVVPTGSVAQSTGEWTFGTDPLADLWFHGLAVVGFDGFGRVPLYDADYAWDVARAQHGLDDEASELSQARGRLLAAFSADPAFEVLHFVPLYFSNAPVEVALDALADLSGARASSLDPAVVREARSVAAVLPEERQRAVLAEFVNLLRAERAVVRELEADAPVGSTLRSEWNDLTAIDEFRTFLEREGFPGGEVLVTPALGPEGRFLSTARGPIVVVGPGESVEPSAVLGAVIRELCYPAVRRVLTPYEARFQDRRTVSDVSDRAATRCGEMLVETHRPEWLTDYRVRFSLDPSGAGFLSTHGFTPGVAVLERELDDALRRELHLNDGSVRGEPRPAGR